MSKFGDFSFTTVCRKEVDSPWSWLVCICATIIVALFFGVSLSFGVMFPVLMEYFQTTRERTGKINAYIKISEGSYSSLVTVGTIFSKTNLRLSFGVLLALTHVRHP